RRQQHCCPGGPDDQEDDLAHPCTSSARNLCCCVSVVVWFMFQISHPHPSDVAVVWQLCVCSLRFYYVRDGRGNVLRTAVRPRPPPGFLPKGQLTDDHAAVGGLAHVVDRERRGRTGVQRFHLDTGSVDGVDVGLDDDMIEGELEVDRHRADQQRVAQRDQVGCAL